MNFDYKRQAVSTV